ncbi:hypothetical protein F0U61_29455 [Archangium violaceum]|uniref:hypothetical protein n=1 Tax=Archangium violaceum TaxID=83451 RepID=UPI002B2C0AE7|nr:hypothetical protein F0U61_29455 [Archangium violaceum]
MPTDSLTDEYADLPPAVRWGIRNAGLLFFVTLAWVPLFNQSRFADLSSWYTDHLHHSFATWVAFFRGLEIYTRPFAEVRGGTGWPYPVEAWGDMPGFAYPPGVMVLFLPLTLVGRFVGLSFHGFAVVSLLYILAITAWAFHQAVQALVVLPRGSRAATLGVTWLILAQMGLQGFFDSAFVGAGLAALVAWRRRKPDVALLWLAAAAFLHFRAVVFAPLGVLALHQCWKERARIRHFAPKLAVTAGVVVLGLVSFVLMYPATQAFREKALRVLSHPNAMGVVVIASLALAGVLMVFRQWLALAAQGLVVALAFVELQNFWWHGAIVLAVPYFIGALREESFKGEVSLARGAWLLWALAIHPVVWRDHPGQLFIEFVKFLRVG